MRNLFATAALALGAAGVFASSGSQAAQPPVYPTRPVRVVMPYPPGGGTDYIGRIIAQSLAKSLGQSFVVDNRTGAGGSIGTDIAAKAPHDGYTLLVNNISLAVNASIYPKLPYDTKKDLTALCMVGQQPNVLLVHPSVPVHTLRELLDYNKANPKQIAYGSGGYGSSTYFATELLKLVTKAEFVHVPYKGVGPATTALLSGQVQMFFSTLGPALPQIQAGRARALGVTTVKRSPYLPNVPTISEAGVPGYEYSTWYGLWLPAGSPLPIVTILANEVEKSLGTAEFKEAAQSQGIEPLFMPPDRFDAFVRSEIDKWAKVVKATGAKPE